MNLIVLFIHYLNFAFQPGDLLFQDCDCGSMCDAIEDVTYGAENRRYSHVALVIREHDTLKVIEANVYGVKIVPLDSFLHRYHDSIGNPTITVGRLKSSFHYLIPKAIHFSMAQLSVPYDTVFLLNNGSYYCSELIYDAFKSANKGRAFFKLAPMTYKIKGSQRIHPSFSSYYESIHCTIPEGKLGINPGSISRDSRLQLFHLY